MHVKRQICADQCQFNIQMPHAFEIALNILADVGKMLKISWKWVKWMNENDDQYLKEIFEKSALKSN